MEDRTEAFKIVSCRAQVGINKSQKINVFTGLITLNNNSLPSPPGIYICLEVMANILKFTTEHVKKNTEPRVKTIQQSRCLLPLTRLKLHFGMYEGGTKTA
jgi:hypothetical protein